MKTADAAWLQRNITARMESRLKSCHIGAAAVIVTQNDETVFEGCFGGMTQQNGEKIGRGTMYRLASMSKPITAAAIGILWDRGLLDLHDPIEKFIPCFKNLRIRNLDAKGDPCDYGEVKTAPTVYHLLTHTSGIGSEGIAALSWADFTEEECATLESSMEAYAQAGTAFEPGARQAYSPVEGFDILARIAEVVTDTDYQTFLKEELFAPCDMTDTTFVPDEGQWGRMVTLHDRVDGMNAVGASVPGRVFGNIPPTHYAGGAGLAGTAADYLHFAELLLHRGVFRGKRILSEEYAALLSTPRIPKSIMKGDQRWGLGVRVITEESYRRLPVGTYGWSGAYGTHFWVDPTNNMTAVYMKNSLYDGGSEAVTAAEFESDVANACK